ncbi:type I glyceraldehyde-3-phosphate dehydrogenase [Raoultella terrigena]|jgi:glyceraldehyde 3-phosphate dehydrogenase|uniref:Glyceraldehyde-3-phosphate dehydrogenase n=1 Tax=Raoultella terrigena TaxID=577 RepID=A0A7Z8ZCU7_RAOTE|nr:type I glyceraldehyde-3-phosphate dehydrogenase [Raoultella terrigena]AJF72953.1 glyceraldehyde-3-phosphate dehydrogenase [Raoultella ornithinolytica]MCE9901650.1 type I glyceraldehyde-3-phosphate dehydrogenase [Raoultella terrigena]MEB7597659.1 type I glyceraldehyde-3-phosphate dehydrogenase [Raoultella terrigena]MEB8193499.1 type I glyceraldehyde-3-phosphate dehydrogenase [Raoultella terrigena]QPF06657.1 type I glyceraldehyde-3-phosphate dehydrogenase [Raoultella terrigena]
MSKLGINGFGRIGRLVLRRLLEVNSPLEVVAINDLTSPKVLAYLLKHDSNYGPFPWSVDFTDDALIVNGKSITVYAEKEARNIPWESAGAELIVECTGFYTSTEKAQAHLSAGAKKVLISAPAGEMKTIVYNVNDDTLTADDTIISVASCTTNCLAPMAKVLHDAFGIRLGTMTTIHAYTGTQSLVDGPRGKDLRASRAAAENIIPHTTGAAKAIGLVIPELSGRLKGHAQRVPTKTGSVTELVSILERKVTAEEVNQAMKNAAANNESFGYTEEEIVSSDVIGSHFGSIYDATQLEIAEAGDVQLVKTVAWYDNEYGFVTQLIRVLERFAK